MTRDSSAANPSDTAALSNTTANPSDIAALDNTTANPSDIAVPDNTSPSSIRKNAITSEDNTSLSFRSIRKKVIDSSINRLTELGKLVGVVSNEEETLKKLAEKSCKPIWKGIDTILLTEDNVDKQSVINLVKAIIEGPYNTAFPDPTEQESPEELMRRVMEGGNPKQFSTASFKNIDEAGKYANIIFNSKDPKEVEKAKEEFANNFIGLASVEDYVGTNTALIAYVLRSKNYQQYPAGDMVRHGLELIVENKKGNNEKFVLAVWEADNPALKQDFWIADENNPSQLKPNLGMSSMPPNSRIGVFENGFGARPLNIDYVQPPLSPESASCHGLIFYMIPYKGASDKEIAEAIKKYLNEFYRVLPDEKLNEIHNDGKTNYMEKYANYCSERSDSIAEIIKQSKSENPVDSLAVYLKYMPDEESRKEFIKNKQEFIETITLPKARTLSWENGAIEDFESLKVLIDEQYKHNPEIIAAIFQETLKNLKEELSKDHLAVKKMEGQLDKIIGKEIALYGENLFDKAMHLEDKERLKKYENPSTPEEIAEKQQKQLESKEGMRVFALNMVANAMTHDANPLTKISTQITNAKLLPIFDAIRPFIKEDILDPTIQLTNEVSAGVLKQALEYKLTNQVSKPSARELDRSNGGIDRG